MTLRVAGVGVCGDRVSGGGGGGRSGETGVGGWTRSGFQLHAQWDFWGPGSRVTGRTGCREQPAGASVAPESDVGSLSTAVGVQEQVGRETCQWLNWETRELLRCEDVGGPCARGSSARR